MSYVQGLWEGQQVTVDRTRQCFVCQNAAYWALTLMEPTEDLRKLHSPRTILLCPVHAGNMGRHEFVLATVQEKPVLRNRRKR